MPQRHIPISESAVRQGLAVLRKDKLLRPLVDAIDPPRSTAKKDPFHALVVSILNQQISRIAAKAIEKRLASLAGSPFKPDSLVGMSKSRLRSIGLSQTKAECVVACSKHALKHALSARSCLSLSDEEILDRLMTIKGIGAWSGQMVLIFGLGRQDVMPDGDGGIVRAASNLFKIEGRAKAREKLIATSSSWSPHRTLAAWYLWRSLAD